MASSDTIMVRQSDRVGLDPEADPGGNQMMWMQTNRIEPANRVI
jgi:hypothetical protein